MKETQPFTVFQLHRIVQLEEGIMHVNHFEGTMKDANCDVLFVGDEDNEKQIDRTVIKAMKGGLFGVFKELKDEGLADIAGQIIFIGKNS